MTTAATLARLVAGGFGSGSMPLSPGTAGSVLALPFGAALMAGPPWALPAAALLATLCGLWAIRASGAVGDPGWIVIDEIAGQWVSLLGLGRPTLTGLLVALLVFRIIDIAKPGPVGWADRQEGAAAIMADDLIAGALSAGVLWAFRAYWPHLFD